MSRLSSFWISLLGSCFHLQGWAVPKLEISTRIMFFSYLYFRLRIGVGLGVDTKIHHHAKYFKHLQRIHKDRAVEICMYIFFIHRFTKNGPPQISHEDGSSKTSLTTVYPNMVGLAFPVRTLSAILDAPPSQMLRLASCDTRISLSSLPPTRNHFLRPGALLADTPLASVCLRIHNICVWSMDYGPATGQVLVLGASFFF